MLDILLYTISFFPPNFFLPCPPHAPLPILYQHRQSSDGTGGVGSNSQTINHCLTHSIPHGTLPCQNPQTPSPFFISSMLGLIKGSTINDFRGECALSAGEGLEKGRGGAEQAPLCCPMETVEGGDVFLASPTGILCSFSHRSKETSMSLR